MIEIEKRPDRPGQPWQIYATWRDGHYGHERSERYCQVLIDQNEDPAVEALQLSEGLRQISHAIRRDRQQGMEKAGD